MLLREATSETYGPWVYSHNINLHYFNIVLLFTFPLLYSFNVVNHALAVHDKWVNNDENIQA